MAVPLTFCLRGGLRAAVERRAWEAERVFSNSPLLGALAVAGSTVVLREAVEGEVSLVSGSGGEGVQPKLVAIEHSSSTAAVAAPWPATCCATW